MSGWVKTYRQLTEWEWYKDSQMVHLLCHLILKANHADLKWRGIDIKRGQLLTSRRLLSDQTGISEQSIRTCLERLKSTHEITIKSTNRNTVITVSNYDEYQSSETESNQPFNQQPNQQSTSNQPAINQPSNKNDKNDKNYKKNILSEINSDDFPEINSDYLEITKAFHTLFRNNLIEAGASTTTIDKAKGTWIDPIRLMIESDGYTIDDLREVFQFLKKDAFWKQNILSTSKLREQMHKLKLKIKNGNTSTKEATSWEELAEVISTFAD